MNTTSTAIVKMGIGINLGLTKKHVREKRTYHNLARYLFRSGKLDDKAIDTISLGRSTFSRRLLKIIHQTRALRGINPEEREK